MESTGCYSSATIESQPSDKVEMLVKANLSNLGRSADGKSVVYRTLDLEGHSLRDISILRRYHYLETLNLSYNNATDLEALDEMSYLRYLNVAHNNLSELLNFRPPLALQVADFSDNQIEEMRELADHHALKELNVSKNNIQVIHGLSALKQLTHLNLANNQITKIEHLDLPPLKCLNLSGNMISAIENLDSLKLLQVLDLSNNQISGLRGLEDHPLLHTLDLHGNQISDLGQVTHLLDLGLLASLDLRQNPIQKDDQYRLFYVFSLPWLNNLDGVPVSPEEKVNAKNKFSPSRELMAAKRHMFHVTKALQQPVRLKFR
jgi:internalin A